MTIHVPITVYEELYKEDVETFKILSYSVAKDFVVTNFEGKTYLKYIINKKETI